MNEPSHSHRPATRDASRPESALHASARGEAGEGIGPRDEARIGASRAGEPTMAARLSPRSAALRLMTDRRRSSLAAVVAGGMAVLLLGGMVVVWRRSDAAGRSSARRTVVLEPLDLSPNATGKAAPPSGPTPAPQPAIAAPAPPLIQLSHGLSAVLPPAAPPAPQPRGVVEQMLDNRFSLKDVATHAGEPFTITLVNAGAVPHNFHLLGVTGDGGQEVKTDLLAAGQSATLTWTNPTPGSYTFRCDVHPDEMTGILTVEPAANAVQPDDQPSAPPTAPTAAPQPTAPAPAQVLAAAPGTFAAGWNLVAGPAGTVLLGTLGPLYRLDASGAAFEPVQAGSPLVAGRGYWAFFPTAITPVLPAGERQPLWLRLPAGRSTLIGNPSSRPVSVTGADAVWTYDPATRTYAVTSVLAPGQGAWAFSYSGATITMMPQ